MLDCGPDHRTAGIRLAALEQRPRHRCTTSHGGTPPAGPLHLQSTRLRIDAPAYTGQATLTQNALDAKVAADSRLSWSLRFDRAPDKAWLQFHDGRRLPLNEQDGQWQAQDVARAPVLYRVVSEPALAETRLHRLDVVADRAPSVRVLEPAASLVLASPGQRQWSLRFEAGDDYGVAAQATLSITTTQGSGENITFVRRSVSLTGSGAPTARRFAHTLDLAALGAQPGNDVIAQLEVRDNHAPIPQAGRSSSVILRLPSAEVALGAELEGRIRKTLPAYFRSQRQIIIDAEALIRQRRGLAADDFIKRSDAIGVDQRILRLRYGQFLGEARSAADRDQRPPAIRRPQMATTTITSTTMARRPMRTTTMAMTMAVQPTQIPRRCSAARPTCFPSTDTPTTTPRRRPCSTRRPVPR